MAPARTAPKPPENDKPVEKPEARILPDVPMVEHLKIIGERDTLAANFAKAQRIIKRMEAQLGTVMSSLAEAEQTADDHKANLLIVSKALEAAQQELQKLKQGKKG